MKKVAQNVQSINNCAVRRYYCLQLMLEDCLQLYAGGISFTTAIDAGICAPSVREDAEDTASGT